MPSVVVSASVATLISARPSAPSTTFPVKPPVMSRLLTPESVKLKDVPASNPDVVTTIRAVSPSSMALCKLATLSVGKIDVSAMLMLALLLLTMPLPGTMAFSLKVSDSVPSVRLSDANCKLTRACPCALSVALPLRLDVLVLTKPTRSSFEMPDKV